MSEPAAPVGTGWWQRSVDAAPSAMSRRAVLQGLLAAGGLLAGLGVGPEAAEAAPGDDARTERRGALAMQKEYGWSFGAALESLTFDGESRQPFDRAALARLPDDLRPARRRHAPYYVPTLFQSPAALPRAVPAGDAVPIVPLEHALRPIFTPAMEVAYQRGQALASLFHGVWSRAAVIVDLPGPEAVAFAAGAAEVLDPVFLFDNWPHPRGVVPAHLALAAAAYYQPLFARRAAPAGAPPMLVLDRWRLASYTDDAEQFDNRHVARVPGAPSLQAIDVAHVLYVAPTAADTVELDDLNDDFMLYAAAGLDVKMVAADAFGPDLVELALAAAHPRRDRREDDRHRCFYGHRAAAHAWFWHDYPWVKPPPHGPGTVVAPAFHRPGTSYAPAHHATAYASGAPGLATVRAQPPWFGSVPVMVSVNNGAILGAALSRSGSWNRATSSGSGG